MSCAHQKQDFCAILTNIHLRNYLYAPTKFPQICKYSPITGRFCAKIIAQVCPYGIIRTNRKTLVLQVNTHKEVQCETGGPVRLNHAEKVHGLFPRDSFLLCKLTVRCIVCHYLPTMFLNNPTYILPIFIIEFLYPQGLVHLRINQKL